MKNLQKKHIADTYRSLILEVHISHVRLRNGDRIPDYNPTALGNVEHRYRYAVLQLVNEAKRAEKKKIT